MQSLCQILCLDDSITAEARFSSGEKSLIRQVANFNAMHDVLHHIGFQRGRSGKGEQHSSYGFKVTTVMALGHFGWTLSTYRHKAEIFIWADKEASHKSWKAVEIPGMIFHFKAADCSIICVVQGGYQKRKFEAYCVWKELVNFWAAEGPVHGGRENYQCRVLSQNSLMKHRTLISRYLI
jgi:hypothetical protein